MAASKSKGQTALQAFDQDMAWCEQHLWIQPRDSPAIRLRWNAAQRMVIAACRRQLKAGRPIRVIILKARQLGISTFWAAFAFAQSMRHRGVRGYLVAHKAGTTKSIWSMHRTFVRYTGSRGWAERFAQVEGPLLWKHGSQLECDTAGGQGVGHGATVTFLHLSEASRYGAGKSRETQQEVWQTVAGIRAALSKAPYSVEAIESTANGLEWFHDQWEQAVKGDSHYQPLFIAWYHEQTYVAALGTCGLNSQKDLTEYERELVKRAGVTLEQLCWRRAKIASDFGGQVRLFREQYPSTPGEAFLVSGSPVFDADRLELYMQWVEPPVWRGEIRYDPPAGWLPVEDANGPVRIWKLPKRRHGYVIGADVAECLDDKSDEDTAVVRDADNAEIVAVLRGRFEPGEFAAYLAGLAWYYNQALLAVEKNNQGLAVVGALRGKLGGKAMYSRLYRYRRVDRATGATQLVYGWPTSETTKAAAVEAEYQLLRHGIERCPSEEVLSQAATFINLPHKKMGAAAGSHDDLVMAWVISAAAMPYAATGRTDKAARSARIDELLARSTEDPEGGAPFEFNQ